jgi:predicted nucleic acid-binding protein
MRVLFDVNVVLDVVLDRHPWVNDAKPLVEAVLAGKIEGYLAATTITTVYYVARKSAGPERALLAVTLCLQAFEVASVNAEVLAAAAALQGPDFEDNVQIAAARAASCDSLVTRDQAGFATSTIRAVSPAALVAEISE